MLPLVIKDLLCISLLFFPGSFSAFVHLEVNVFAVGLLGLEGQFLFTLDADFVTISLLKFRGTVLQRFVTDLLIHRVVFIRRIKSSFIDVFSLLGSPIELFYKLVTICRNLIM